MLKGFKDFLMRGNVIDLAVAVVVGSAFTAVVTAFTNSIIKPVINLAGTGGGVGQGLVLQLNPSDPNDPSTKIDFSVGINAVITFFITAGVVYFLFVLPMQKLQERRNKGKEDTTAATEAELLAEIRNLLRREQGLSTVKGGYPAKDEEETTVGASTSSTSVSSSGSTNGSNKN